MKAYVIQMLTVGAMETLNEYSLEQAQELHKLAHFKPTTIEDIQRNIINSVKAHWRDGVPLNFTAYLPDHLYRVYTADVIEAETHVYDINTRVEIPIINIDGVLAPVTEHVRVAEWFPTDDPERLFRAMPEATVEGYDSLSVNGHPYGTPEQDDSENEREGEKEDGN